MKKLHPSASAFMWEGLVITEYSSGCLRQALIASKGIRTDIPEAYQRVGAAHEEMHEIELAHTANVQSYEREVPIKIELTDDVMYSGRMDFVCQYDKIGTVIHETKGTISKNTRLKVIRKGQPKINQLAQLVSYMIAKQVQFGKLICGYYEEDEEQDNKLVLQERRDFKVQIDDEGFVLVDGLPSGYTVYDQMAHRNAQAEVITQEVIADRPSGYQDKYKGPCAFCTFKETCNRYDAGMLPTVEEFIDSAKKDVELSELQKKPDPQPNKVKRKKGKEK